MLSERAGDEGKTAGPVIPRSDPTDPRRDRDRKMQPEHDSDKT